MTMEPDEQDDVRWLRDEHETRRLTARIKTLEEALADYALHYGLTDLALQALLETKDAPADPTGERR